MRHRYRVIAQRTPTAWLGMVTPGPELLVKVLTDCVLRRCDRTSDGYEVELGLKRPTHMDAVAEIASAAEQAGLYAVEMYVTEMLKRGAAATAGAALGAAGGGATVRNAAGTITGTFVGAVLGDLIAERIGVPVANYHARRVGYGGAWEITRTGGWLPRPEPAQ